MGGELSDFLWVASNSATSAGQDIGDRLQEKPEEEPLPYAPQHHRRLSMAGRVLLITSFLAGCQLLTPGQEIGVETRSETSEVSLLLRASEYVYAQGEPVKLCLEVVNRSHRPVRLRFPSAQRYDRRIHNVQGQEMWRWSSERLFAQMPVRRDSCTWRRETHISRGDGCNPAARSLHGHQGSSGD
jgi:hypothetical protein